MEIIGYLLSILMGLTLGLFGGGGSILTLPIMVYFFGVSPVLGTAYSLFVVGTVALVGSVRKAKEKIIDYKVAALFATPSILAVFLTRSFIIPALPEFIHLGQQAFSKDLLLMLFFAVVMLVAAFSMIRSAKKAETKEVQIQYWKIVLDGLLVGVVTGLVGAGGGFLIVPALVILLGLEMKAAVATSLLIISLKSLLGFLGDLSAGQQMDWQFLTTFTGLAIAGMFVGLWLNKRWDARGLKRFFGYFVLAMGVLILLLELIIKS